VFQHPLGLFSINFLFSSKQQQVQQQQLESVSTQTAALTLRAPVSIATKQNPDVTGNDIFTLTIHPPDHSQDRVVVNNVGSSNSTSSSGGSMIFKAKPQFLMLEVVRLPFHESDLDDQLGSLDYG